MIGGEGFLNHAGRSPIGETAVDADDIEAGVRERLEKFKGEELVRQLVDFFLLSLVEVEFTADPEPRAIHNADPGRVELSRQATAQLREPYAPAD